MLFEWTIHFQLRLRNKEFRTKFGNRHELFNKNLVEWMERMNNNNFHGGAQPDMADLKVTLF